MKNSRRRQALLHGLVCLSVVVFTIAASGSGNKVASWMPREAIVALALAQGAIVAARRRAPLAVLAGTTTVAAAMILVGYAPASASCSVLAAAFAVPVYRGEVYSGNQRLLGAAACLAAVVGLILATGPSSGGRSSPWELLTVGVVVVAAWIFGDATRIRHAYIDELVARAARLEAEEGERAARAVADERLRIARELHDIIGHTISLITIQAEAAGRTARTNPGAVAPHLATISAASREALTEMRHVLAVLRPDDAPALAPQPSLDALPELVTRIESGGIAVRLCSTASDLPTGLALTVYRLVQESLTNVLKHAGPGAAADVTIVQEEGTLRVSIRDDGRGSAAHRPSTAAHGIVGMRERVAAYNGTFRAGPRADGGFEVEAAIPFAAQGPQP